jgi:uncharacterized membrane protein
MKKSYLLTALGLLTCVLLFNNCDKKVAKLSSPPITTNGNTNTLPAGCDTVTYTEDIKAIMDAKCGDAQGCHISGQFASGGISLTTYAEVKAQADNNKIKVQVFDLGAMPQSPVTLTQAEKDLLFCWLNNGTKQ